MVCCTEQAAEQIRAQLATRGHGMGLRIGVKTSGCSGLAYALELCDDLRASDLVFDSHGVKLIVDKGALPYLAGTRLDYVRKDLGAGFDFVNPNETARCGCGQSFHV